MDAEDRKAALSSFNPDEIDAEFLPFLERINGLPHAVSMQCCQGHVEYKPIGAGTAEQSGRWGYLQLLMELDLAEWLAEVIRDCDWLLLEKSQTWDEQAAMAPGVTQNESYVLTFAWDASQWPTPAEDICRFIEEYHDEDRVCGRLGDTDSNVAAIMSIHDDSLVPAHR